MRKAKLVSDDPKRPTTEDGASVEGEALPVPQAPEPTGEATGTAAIFAPPSQAAVFDAAQAELKAKQPVAPKRPAPRKPPPPPPPPRKPTQADATSIEFEVPARLTQKPPPPPPPVAKGEPQPDVKVKAKGGMFGKILVDNGLLTEEQRDACVAILAEPDNVLPFGEVAVAKGFISRETLEHVLKVQKSYVSGVRKEQSRAIPLPKELVEAAVEPADSGRDAERMHAWLDSALKHNASDLHLMAGKPLVLRHHGRLTNAKGAAIGVDDASRFLHALLDADERAALDERRSLTKCIDLPGGARVRACIFHHTGGLNGAFRLIPATVPSLVELELPSAIGKFATYSQGLVLVTGPISSGKTTTLAALIDVINQERYHHIITVEDPIEFVHQSNCSLITQRQVGQHTESFANALRASLREDPDVIVVGEMHDLETAQLAVSAAETGHLVFATLHTQSAVRSVNRVLDLFPPEETRQIRTVLAENLRGVITQQLVRRADTQGRVPVVELLFVTPAIRNLIREEKTHQIKNAIQISKEAGNLALEDHADELLERKLISEQTHARVTQERS